MPKHSIKNKLKHSVRNDNMWRVRISRDKKRENKKRGLCYNDRCDLYVSFYDKDLD